MGDREGTRDGLDNPEQLSKALAELAERGQRIVGAFLERQAGNDAFTVPDPGIVGKAFFDLSARMLADPAALVEAQGELWRKYAELWEATAKRLQGEEVEPVAVPQKGDRRFHDDAWTADVVFDFIKQSYLLTSDWLQATVRKVDGLDEQTRRKVDFYTRQLVDALAPSNFVLTNPKVLRTTAETGGENLLKGLDHLLQDLEAGKGRLKISMTNPAAFSLGENIAVTPGKVVYQNELMQLIQYAPSTETVCERPLLIVPPWINKYYVLDLQPKNSFIKWVVDQGHTVFVVSWVNPDESLAHKTFEDYMQEGPLAAMEAIEQATGEHDINIVGYCIGGTLVACMLAYLAAKQDDRVKSATYLTTMIDYSDAGELAVFIDDEQLALMEEHMKKKGYLEGEHMATVFNLMRDKDLIWSFVVNNYLLGRDPIPFDLLYWNSDATRMPFMMHTFYLRNMYLENKVIEPGGISLAGVPIDLRTIRVPSYVMATREDHIAPWKSTYAATQIYSGPVRFVLAASGHIAGVINPPAAHKYCHWTNPRRPKDPDRWLKGASQREGSWWPDWDQWVKRHAGKRDVPARRPGGGKLKPIEDAPGSYVKVRLAD